MKKDNKNKGKRMITTTNPLFLSKGFELIKAFDNPQDEFLTTKLSKKANISWGHSQKMIKQLCDTGYLTKEKLQGRNRTIRLTDKGKKVWYMMEELGTII